MKISVKRLTKMLAPLHYALLMRDNPTKSLHYASQLVVDGLTDHLFVYAGGKRGEALVAYGAISIIHGLPVVKGLVETLLVVLEGCDPERLCTILAGETDAKQWEQRLVSHLPTVIEDLRAQRSDQLLSNTAHVRDKAATVISCLPRSPSLEELCASLATHLTYALKKEAERIAHFAGVCQIPDGQSLYEAAALGILYASDEKAPFWTCGGNPLTDVAFLQLIQIVVDRLLMIYPIQLPLVLSH